MVRKKLFKIRYSVLGLVMLSLVLFVSCSAKNVMYKIDFEKEETIEYLTACFNDSYSDSSVSIIDNVSGLKGNVFKAKVSEPSPGDTWWVSGIKFINPKESEEESFKNISKFDFKYKSSVDYSNDIKFMIQIVWKNIVNEMEVASLWVDFPIKNNTDKVEIFEVYLDDYTNQILNESTDYYLDWIMIGLESAAGEDFNNGTFYIDDIRFITGN